MGAEPADSRDDAGTRSADYAVGLIGPAAAELLATSGTGQVLAVFRRSFYVEMAGGIACFGPPSLGAGPLNVLADLPSALDWQARGLRQGDTAQVGDDCFRLQDGTLFHWPAATVWAPMPIPGQWRPVMLGQGLAVLGRAVRGRLPDQGLGRFIPALARGEPVAATPPTDALDIGATAAPAIAAVVAWLHDTEGDPPDAIRRLIGLGPGLTPSGDDVLGGILIALRAFGRTVDADRLTSVVLPLAEAGTGRISAAHLAQAARGLGSAALHDILAALAAGATDGIDDRIAAIDAIGHCSGWDALAGAVAAGVTISSGHQG